MGCATIKPQKRLPNVNETPDLKSYDKILVAFSGGKDSLACLLTLFDAGVDPSRIELWHHDIDGRADEGLMDWPVTAAYCEAVAEAFKLPIFFSWKVGGFEREMLRDGNLTAPISWEEPGTNGDKVIRTAGGERGKEGRRMRFPQVSADLRVRWCSAYLKIDVMDRALRNDPRFSGKRTLVITGERAEESPARARYATMEPHRADGRAARSRRHVDTWRVAHSMTEREVWSIIERYRVVPHPAYRAGWGRVSCASCIFGSRDQWASLAKIAPDHVEKIASYEERFGSTIKRSESVREQVAKGTPYAVLETPEGRQAVREALSREWTRPVVLGPDEVWTLPAGAFGDAAGPV